MFQHEHATFNLHKDVLLLPPPEAEQSEEQLYQEISKVDSCTFLAPACFPTRMKKIASFRFPAGKCYLYSLLGQQQEVNRKGKCVFSVYSAQFMSHMHLKKWRHKLKAAYVYKLNLSF